ncbi:MAG: hypothetical protein JWL60_2612 [Gemmatimonadetes bacterium]|jgi:hypothetical protein|nr:hypothetical protein [Gemmatimonadota bacterium]
MTSDEEVSLRGDAHPADVREQRLSRLEDFEVADGFPDIRGWPARGSNGRDLGVVGELLVDTDLLEVSAVDVHLGVGAAGIRGNTIAATRVPIEAVQIQSDRYVVVDVEMVPCVDVLQDGTDASANPREGARRVPCGQIGIRRRSGRDGRPVLPPLAEPEGHP